MEILPLLCLVAFTGLTKGAGVLPDGPLNATIGGTIMFNVTAENPFQSVSWKFGDKNIISHSGSANQTAPEYEGRIDLVPSTGSLELRNLTLSDSGEYSVILVALGEFPQEGTTTLEVNEDVSNVKVTASSTDLLEFDISVSLSCSSSGSSLSFLWLNGSSNITQSDRVQITDGGATLTLINVTRYDQGPFRCHVFNSFSNGTSDPFNLSISYGPENVGVTGSQTYYAKGSSISLSCSVASRPAAEVSWLVNGDQLSDTGPELRLTNVQMNQSGDYSCQAFNNKTLRNETSQPSAVSVIERISGASLTPSSSLLIEGNSFNLTCEADGSILNRRWKKDGSTLIGFGNVEYCDGMKVLCFHPLMRKDIGSYSCEPYNPFSSDEAQYNITTPYYGPDEVEISGPTHVNIGGTMILHCTAVSKPPAIYIWKRNGAEIHRSPVLSKVVTGYSDGGTYTCEAINEISGKRSSFSKYLHITDHQPQQTGLSSGYLALIVSGVIILIGAVCVVCWYNQHKQLKRASDTTSVVTGGSRPGHQIILKK